uniref:Uncharacterized protein n=1 Tax=Grammatophora oceanica TaxID=210454 RepID=A0A7S1VRN3_9STRA|mmetsp:Transcript_52366/g.78253  ORF Transcript_52366/g.78253 Transcript_52366/m.78253 type:complete len:179 (+) Transcript_52366:1-537(+)
MGSLRYLGIEMLERSGLLQALLAPRPCNLRTIRVGYGAVVSDSDFHELLGFLSDPECKMEELAGSIEFENNLDNTSIMNKRCQSLINVVEYENESLREPIYIRGNIAANYKRSFEFWSWMNTVCPNRLKLRRAELTFALADEIAEFALKGDFDDDSASAIFSLVKSTCQNWAEGSSQG